MEISRLSPTPPIIAALADILIEVVAAGGSVSFMHPLSPQAATDFWARSLGAADAGQRVVLGAMVDNELAGAR